MRQYCRITKLSRWKWVSLLAMILFEKSASTFCWFIVHSTNFLCCTWIVGSCSKLVGLCENDKETLLWKYALTSLSKCLVPDHDDSGVSATISRTVLMFYVELTACSRRTRRSLSDSVPWIIWLDSLLVRQLNQYPVHILNEKCKLLVQNLHYFKSIDLQWKRVVLSCSAPFLIEISPVTLSFYY